MNIILHVKAFKGVMPSPMSTRRTWQPFKVNGEGQEANPRPIIADPSDHLRTLQTPTPQNSQSSPLLPNRALPLIPADYRSSKTTTELTTVRKQHKSQLNDAAATGARLLMSSGFAECVYNLSQYLVYECIETH